MASQKTVPSAPDGTYRVPADAGASSPASLDHGVIEELGSIDAPRVDVGQRVEARPGRAPVYVAAFLIAVLSGAALFVSGYTLGQRQDWSAGTASSLQERFQPFWDAYGKITHDFVHPYDEKKLVEGAIDGMFKSLGDPYSSYMSSDDYKRTLSALSGQFEGIGAEMATRDTVTKRRCETIGGTCALVVVRPLRDSPATRAGLRKDDRVLAVNGVTVTGKTLDDTVKLVRGPRGTSVTLTIDRGPAARFDVTIERDIITTEDVRSEVLAGGRVGYIKIESFSSASADDFKTQLRELVADRKIRHVVLDLRDDPGGFVDAAQAIASEFIGEGPIYWQEDAQGSKVAKNALPGGVATDPSIEVVAIVNEASASATEIVAGALQDTGRARLVGVKTFGKGTIQTWETLEPDSGGFRLSVAKWLTPKQRWIHGTGLEPDVVIKAPETVNEGEDPVRDRAVEVLLEGDASTGVDDAPGRRAGLALAA